jgi:branched-subunit amino acid transport protein
MSMLRLLTAGLLPLWPRFKPRSVHVGFVVDKVTLGQVFLQVLQFSPVNIIPPWLSIIIYHLGDEQWWMQFKDIVSLTPLT